MPTNFIFRFEKANLFIPFQMPNKRQRQAAINRQTTPEDARRSSVIARMEKIKDQLQIPEYVEENQPRVWLEEAYDLGDLVFAVLDIPWKAFYEKAQSLLEQYKDYEMTIRTDLLTQVDWRHYQPPQPEKESREPSFKKWFSLDLFTRPAKNPLRRSLLQQQKGHQTALPERLPRDWPLRNRRPIARWLSCITMSRILYPIIRLWPSYGLTIAPTPHRITICKPLKRWT